MALPQSPFGASSSSPGRGEIILSLLPPDRQVLTKWTYQYPLKLIAPDPHLANDLPVTMAFLLTYGGGLIGGDKIYLRICLADQTRLVLLTQGSTKIFKSPHRGVVSGQTLSVIVGRGASLCYLPDPTQPFGESVFEQRQTFHIHKESSLCVLDWVSEGRKARGESWQLWKWKSRNEVRERCSESENLGRLLLRDALILDDEADRGGGLLEKSNSMGVFGTLILYGAMFSDLGNFLLNEFVTQPKLGNKNWKKENEKTEMEIEGERKQAIEKNEGLLWTVARVRGFVLVKFGSREVDGARRWLRTLIKREGSLEHNFGHQALMCLR